MRRTTRWLSVESVHRHGDHRRDRRWNAQRRQGDVDFYVCGPSATSLPATTRDVPQLRGTSPGRRKSGEQLLRHVRWRAHRPWRGLLLLRDTGQGTPTTRTVPVSRTSPTSASPWRRTSQPSSRTPHGWAGQSGDSDQRYGDHQRPRHAVDWHRRHHHLHRLWARRYILLPRLCTRAPSRM